MQVLETEWRPSVIASGSKRIQNKQLNKDNTIQHYHISSMYGLLPP